MTGPVREAKSRAQAALKRWREARGAVNDPRSVPARLDSIVNIAERTIAAIGQDIVTEAEALAIELSGLQFPVDADDSLSALEAATYTLDGALTRLSRAAARAGFALADEDLGLPPGVRVPAKEIADQLEAFVAAVNEVRPVLQKLADAQAGDSSENSKQANLVRSLIEKASVKIEIVDVKTGKISLIDVSGLAAVAQQLARLLQSFAATVTDAAVHLSSWLSQQAPVWIRSVLSPLKRGAGRLAESSAAWIRQRGGGPAQELPAATVERADAPFDLLAVEAMIHRGETPPPAAVPFMTVFRANRLDQKSIAALGHLTALRRLELSLPLDADLAPLANLSALQTLSLYGPQNSDLTPLAGLTALQSLYLSGTQVRDLKPLARLTALQSLNLDGTPVGDLTPLARLTALRSLNLIRTQVRDLTPLARLTALQSLHLDSTQITDLTPLGDLTALQSLSLSHTRVSNLAPLHAVASLTSIAMNRDDRLIATLRRPVHYDGIRYIIERS